MKLRSWPGIRVGQAIRWFGNWPRRACNGCIVSSRSHFCRGKCWTRSCLPIPGPAHTYPNVVWGDCGWMCSRSTNLALGWRFLRYGGGGDVLRWPQQVGPSPNHCRRRLRHLHQCRRPRFKVYDRAATLLELISTSAATLYIPRAHIRINAPPKQSSTPSNDLRAAFRTTRQLFVGSIDNSLKLAPSAIIQPGNQINCQRAVVLQNIYSSQTLSSVPRQASTNKQTNKKQKQNLAPQ